MNELLKSVHKLACMRYSQVSPDKVGIILNPYAREGVPSTPLTAPREMADTCAWSAQVYMGRGKWGNIAGEGPTPEAALASLHRGMVEAHRAVDERRGVVLSEATTLPGNRPPQPSPEHRWDGALDRWYLPSEPHPKGDEGPVLSHARHA